MSRGAGRVERRVLLGVLSLEEQLGLKPAYRDLAVGVYDVDAPSVAQIASVARAARRMEQRGLVDIYVSERDHRLRFVGASPWAFAAMLATTAMNKDSPGRIVPGGIIEDLSVMVEVLKSGVAEGRFEVMRRQERLDPRTPPVTVPPGVVPIVSEPSPMLGREKPPGGVTIRSLDPKYSTQ